MAGNRGPYRKRPVAVRLMEKVEIQPDGCWLWTGSCSFNGYAQLSVTGRTRQAHRLSYEEFVGPIPDGLDIDHMCHNDDPTCGGGQDCAHRRCINPEHLTPATRRENLGRSSHVGGIRPGARSVHADKTHCPAGHPYDGENTYIPPSRNARYCRQCKREQTRARRAQRRQDT